MFKISTDLRPLAVLLCSSILLTAASSLEPGQSATLPDVLARCGSYVKGYGGQVSSVVAQERSEQTALDVSQERWAQTQTTWEDWNNLTAPVRRQATRVLVSEFALVRAGGATEEWAGFRDVVEVDGKPVQDRRDRLHRLFAEGGPAAAQKARKIADEAARFNLGPVPRDFNVPTTSLLFLHPANQARFAWRKAGETELAGQTVWELTFEERAKPTIIRTARGKNIPASGRVWVNPTSGCVVMTRTAVAGFLADADDSRGIVNVTYALDPSLDMWLPTAMTEQYLSKGPGRLLAKPGPALPTVPGMAPEGMEDPGTSKKLTRSETHYSEFKRLTTSGTIVPR